MAKNYLRIIGTGLLAGFISEAFLGAVFSSPPVRSALYDPKIQSALFIEVTPSRDLFPSVAGLIVLSVIHSWLFVVFKPSIPGTAWWGKGLFWGFTIWAMYWLFQEWFIYHTLLREPIILNLLELTILIIGSLVEGLIISKLLSRIDTKKITATTNG